MRIAVWNDLPSGGGKRALYDHVKGLVARGHHIESWSPPTADQRFLSLGDHVIEHVVPIKKYEPVSWRGAIGFLSGRATWIRGTLKAMDAHCERCAREINSGNFDVVMAGGSLWFAVTSLARHIEGPTLLYLQEPYRKLYEALPRLPWPALPPSRLPLLFAAVERAQDAARTRALRIQARAELDGIRAYDRVLANSYFSRESILRAYGIDARVCYLGIDTERYHNLGLARERFVVGIGKFEPHKRVEVIIEAVARMRSPRPGLVWIGNGGKPSYIRGLVNLAGRLGVTFIPRVDAPHEEVVRLLNQAAVLVCAPRLEPFGYAPIEAGACGLPVVALAEGGLRETVIDGETGLLVASDGELHLALQRIVDDEGLACRMGAAGRRRVEALWGLPAATDRLEMHLLELVRGRTTG